MVYEHNLGKDYCQNAITYLACNQVLLSLGGKADDEKITFFHTCFADAVG